MNIVFKMISRLAIIFMLAIFCFDANAQTYYPMPTANATWTVVEYGYGTIPPETGVTHFGLSGDTMINSLAYHKIYYNQGGLGFDNPENEFNLQTAVLYGVFREDASKKVWLRKQPSDAEDVLIYDFALNLGDTFCFHDEPCGVLCHPVSLVDSILIDGNYRRQIHFNYNGQEEKWIEGIGSAYDNWDGHWCFDGNIAWFLNCYQENGVTLYGTCDYPTGVTAITGESYAPEIFPNPLTDFLTIRQETDDAKIAVETLLGATILTQNLNSGDSQINLSFLSNGIYLLHYSSKNEDRIFKIIKI